MAIGDYSATRDNNASITPGNVRSNDPSRDQQIINAIRQLMADLAGFAGGVSPITSGIQFPATQVPSANANTLDDYEENTYTPVLSFGGATTGITYSIQAGQYVKIGQLVFCQSRIILTSKGSATGQARLSVPFGNTSVTGQSYTPISIGYYGAMVGLTGAFSGYVETNSTSVNLVCHNATGVAFLNETHFSNTSDIIFTVVYRANA